MDKPIAEDFCFPKIIGDAPYYILNKSDPDHSIIHQVLLIAGYPDTADSCPDILETVLHASGIKGNESYRSFLDDLLFEYGYCFYFDSAGCFSVYQWDKDSPTVDFDLSGKLGVAEIPRRDKIQLSNDGYNIQWSTTEVMNDVLLYRASASN